MKNVSIQKRMESSGSTFIRGFAEKPPWFVRTKAKKEHSKRGNAVRPMRLELAQSALNLEFNDYSNRK